MCFTYENVCRIRLVSMKKHLVLCEKTKNWTDISYTAQPINCLRLTNNLVDRLIGGTMKLTTVWIGWSNQSTVCSTIRDTNEISNNRSIDWLCQCELVDHCN
jgi:hypothetical protein